jgi:hypothetical protein
MRHVLRNNDWCVSDGLSFWDNLEVAQSFYNEPQPDVVVLKPTPDFHKSRRNVEKSLDEDIKRLKRVRARE